MFTPWFTVNSKKPVNIDSDEEFSPPKLPVPPMPPLPDDFVYVEGLPPLEHGMPPLFKPDTVPLKEEEENKELKELNEYYVKTIFGIGKITKFRDDDMLEVDLFWKLTDNKAVKLIINKNEADHVPKPDELFDDEITPLSDSDSNDSLEYSDSSLESELFPISKCTQIFSEVNLYILGGLYISTAYLVSVSLLRRLIC